MIERFYNPASGTITVDGKPIDKLDLRSYRRLVGYVGQEPVLFNQSVKENMLLSKPDATDDEIKQALEDANAWSFISKLPKTFNENVGAGGGKLSGGQK
jgi:ABC-type multidrug transport system fused ATPase/permease subunit